jgi:hypothetical protein
MQFEIQIKPKPIKNSFLMQRINDKSAPDSLLPTAVSSDSGK